MYDQDLLENTEELAIAEQCWAEIEAILKKYDCNLKGSGTYYDSGYDDECSCSAEEFGVISNAHTRRIEQYWKDKVAADKLRNQLEVKAAYDALKKRFSKYKNLKIVKIGTTSVSSFWFENLYINHNLVKAPLFNWNSNKYWTIHFKSENHHPVWLDVDEYSSYSGLNGEPHFTTMQWHMTKDGNGSYRDKSHVDWFRYSKRASASYYIDMMAVCELIDTLIEAGVLYFDTVAVGDQYYLSSKDIEESILPAEMRKALAEKYKHLFK